MSALFLGIHFAVWHKLIPEGNFPVFLPRPSLSAEEPGI